MSEYSRLALSLRMQFIYRQHNRVGEMKEEMSILKQNQEKIMNNIVTITNVGEWKQVFDPMTMDQPNGLTQ